MSNETVLLIQLVNFILCVGVSIASFCRARKFAKGATRKWVIAGYSVLGTSALLASVAPLWPAEYRRIAVTLLSFSYLLVMVVNSRGWKNGPPDHTRSRPAAFDEEPHHHTLKGPQ
ncbi:hypothetical protein [Methylibium sp.]|uniref:hypothetical protein n=1 Tax=Methylibium sp. TaxID=2067992 RepID=UPI003BA953AC